jgi:hypothetical protein
MGTYRTQPYTYVRWSLAAAQKFNGYWYRLKNIGIDSMPSCPLAWMKTTKRDIEAAPEGFRAVGAVEAIGGSWATGLLNEEEMKLPSSGFAAATWMLVSAREARWLHN